MMRDDPNPTSRAAAEAAPPPRIAYFVHDLTDAAVARRVGMFAEGGGQIVIGGFRRAAMPAHVGGITAIDLGQTGDLKLVQRARAVLRNIIFRARARRVARGAEVLVARNLESLAIAAAVQAPGQRLVYECLDIHRLLLGNGMASRLLRAAEARLLARVDLVIVSSPAFRDAYFRERRGYAGPILLVENKVPAAGLVATPPRRGGAPWRIAWLGMLRCRRSLLTLRAIAEAAAGQVEVVIAGRVTCGLIPDFDELVAASPHLSFLGAYRPEDLATIYGGAHFAWVIDYYEEGQNSRWLLPNRLYESLAFGTVPLALDEVETGRWLARHGVGRTLSDPVAELPPFLATLDPETFTTLEAAVRALPAASVTTASAECRALVGALGGAA